MASRSPRSAWWVSTPGTGRRLSARRAYLPSISLRTAPPMRPLSPVTSTRRGVMAAGSALQLAVQAEVLRHRRAPAVERITLREVARLPGARLGNVVEVVEVLRERAPRITDVVEEVGADHVPAEAPARLEARLLHPERAHRDLVHAAHFERGVVEARPL